MLLLGSFPDSKEILVASLNNLALHMKLTLDIVIDRLRMKNPEEKNIEVIPSESNAIVSHRQEKWWRS